MVPLVMDSKPVGLSELVNTRKALTEFFNLPYCFLLGIVITIWTALLTAKVLHGILIPVELIPVELTCGGDVMAKRIEGVTEKLLECAKEEFLANGYENTSLRIIAEKAGYTKGVIYIRYPDKESLYRALVEPVADGLCNY